MFSNQIREFRTWPSVHRSLRYDNPLGLIHRVIRSSGMNQTDSHCDPSNCSQSDLQRLRPRKRSWPRDHRSRPCQITTCPGIVAKAELNVGIARCAEVQLDLVLPAEASTKEDDLLQRSRKFGSIRPANPIFRRLERVASFAPSQRRMVWQSRR